MFTRQKMLVLFLCIGIIRGVNALDIETAPSWQGQPSAIGPGDISFVDINQDGWLDLVVLYGSSLPDTAYIYMNNNGTLETTPSWQTSSIVGPGLAVGDINNDGYPDLVTGTNIPFSGGRIEVYMNLSGSVETSPSWIYVDTCGYMWVGLGDVDNDGDLDLAAVGENVPYSPYPKVFYNIGGTFENLPSWEAIDYNIDLSGYWADFDDDGDLDLAVGGWNWQTPNRVYKNENGILEQTASWTSAQPEQAAGLAVGDINLDGFRDLVCSREWMSEASDLIYFNSAGGLNPIPGWSSTYIVSSVKNVLADFDNDGDLDLAVTEDSPVMFPQWNLHIYVNNTGSLETYPSWISDYYPWNTMWGVTAGDVDNDGLITKTKTFMGDGSRKLFYLNQMPIHKILEVKIDGIPLPLTDFCYDLYAGWVSLKNTPPSGSNVMIEYLYSRDIDLAANDDYPSLYKNNIPSPGPPASPYIHVEKTTNKDSVMVYWNKVTQDTSGNLLTIDHYSIHASTDPSFIPDAGNLIAEVTDTFFKESIPAYGINQYYLIFATSTDAKTSKKSNMGYMFHKTVNENPAATNKNWVSLPWHSGYTTVSDLASDLTPSGNPLEKITNLRDDQNCESWIWDPDFYEWGGANFAIQPGRGYEIVTNKDTTLLLVDSNNPDGLINLNENPSTTDKNWVSVPYNAVYATVSDITTEYSPSGNPLEKITNLRDDQNCESWLWDPDFFEWGGANFAIEPGRGYEFVTIKDTFWNPTEYNNEAKQMVGGRWVRKLDLEVYTGKLTESERCPVWSLDDEGYVCVFCHSEPEPQRRRRISKDIVQNKVNDKIFTKLSGVSHIVRCHLHIKGFDSLLFTAYRPCKPCDALTEDMIGSCIMKKGERAAIWFDVANFKEPWQDKEEVILIVEAVKQERGYFAVVNLLLDNTVDIQELVDVELTPIPECWVGIDNPNVIGYSLYQGDKRLNEQVIDKDEYLIEGGVILKPVIKGGYETVYGSGQQGEENAGQPVLNTLGLQVYPNPFSKKTEIRFTNYDLRPTMIRIYDASGRLVKTFSDILCNLNNSVQSVSWDGTDNFGRRIPSGVYFIYFVVNSVGETGEYTKVKKAILLR